MSIRRSRDLRTDPRGTPDPACFKPEKSCLRFDAMLSCAESSAEKQRSHRGFTPELQPTTIDVPVRDPAG